MKILVTGGAGFIGSHVVEQLQLAGHTPIIFDDLSHGMREHISEGIELIVADVRNKAALEASFARHSFSAVIHLAAQTMVPESLDNPVTDCRINLEGILNVLECCRKYHVRHVLFSSSAAVYGDNLNIPLQETESLLPTSPYGITKMTTEHYLRIYHELYGIDATVFRFANVYGERQGEKGEGGVVSIFCKLLSQGKPITVFGNGEQTRDFIYAGDIARAIVAALPLKGYHTINVSTGKETSLNELIHAFEFAVGHKFDVIYEKPRPGDILHSVLNNNNLIEYLKIRPNMDLAQGIQQTYRWYIGKWD